MLTPIEFMQVVTALECAVSREKGRKKPAAKEMISFESIKKILITFTDGSDFEEELLTPARPIKKYSIGEAEEMFGK